MLSSSTILGHLTVLGITIADLSQCLTLEDEWAFIKKHHFNHIKVCHPDKGGDAGTFRSVNDSFNVLRELVSKNQINRFASDSSRATAREPDRRSAASQDEYAPWEWYEESGKVDFVPYIVEPAKSDRSKCNKKTKKEPCAFGGKIAKGHIRIGSWNEDVGSYSWFLHMECWRVPAKIWLAFNGCSDATRVRVAMHLMDSVSICGFSSMPPEQQDIFIEYVRNPNNWARAPSDATKSNSAPSETMPDLLQTHGVLEKKKEKLSGKIKAVKAEHVVPDAPPQSQAQPVRVKNEAALTAVAPVVASSDSALTVRASMPPKRGGSFVMPIPGRDGALPGAMNGLIVVLTGLFPEVGGGSGLNLGKDKVKGMVEAFGGKVTGSVSGRTHILVVGKEPGLGKVSQAEGQPNCQLMYLEDLRDALQNGRDVLAPRAQPVMITNFSSGYNGNGLAGRLKYESESAPKPRKRAPKAMQALAKMLRHE